MGKLYDSNGFGIREDPTRNRLIIDLPPEISSLIGSGKGRRSELEASELSEILSLVKELYLKGV